MKKKLAILIALVLSFALCVFAFAACTPVGGGEESKNSLGFDSTLELEVGGSKPLNAKEGGKDTVWSVDDPTIVELNKNEGSMIKVTGLKEGTATLTATANGVTATCVITVVKKAETETVSILKDGAGITTLSAREGDAAIQLSASSSKGNTITAWESSNTNVATVDDNGRVTIVRAGTTQIIAKVTESIKGSVTLTVQPPEGQTAYEPEMIRQEDYKDHRDQDGKYVFFSESHVMGTPDQVKYIEVRNDNNISFKLAEHWANWYSFQIIKKDIKIDGSHTHRISFFIELSDVLEGASTAPKECVTARITFNDKQYDIPTDGTKTKVEWVGAPLVGSYSMQFIFILGYEDITTDPATQVGYSSAVCKITEITFKDIENEKAQLKTPSFTINDSNVITITDENTASTVGKYVLGFFKNATDTIPYRTVTVTNNTAVNTAMVYPDGDYTVKLRAIAKTAANTDSDWSAATALTVSGSSADTAEQLLNGGSKEVKTNLTWMYWYNKEADWVGGSAVADSDITKKESRADGSIVIAFKTVSGAVYNAIQLVYADNEIYANNAVKAFNVTLDINVASACKITICGKEVELTAGDNIGISVDKEAGGLGEYDPIFDIAFGTKQAGLTSANTFIITNVVFTLK